MNTTKNTRNETPKPIQQTIDATLQDASDLGNNAIKGEKPKVYQAKIITPQPYGVFALCKIFELFQIN